MSRLPFTWESQPDRKPGRLGRWLRLALIAAAIAVSALHWLRL